MLTPVSHGPRADCGDPLGLGALPMGNRRKRSRTSDPLVTIAKLATTLTSDATAQAKLSKKALTPAHRRVTANAKRLRKG